MKFRHGEMKGRDNLGSRGGAWFTSVRKELWGPGSLVSGIWTIKEDPAIQFGSPVVLELGRYIRRQNPQRSTRTRTPWIHRSIPIT